MRICLRSNLFLIVGVIFTLSACNSSDHAVRSPDLPAPELSKIAVSCPNASPSIAVGAQSTCYAQCTYIQVNSNGDRILSQPTFCKDITWTTDNGNVVSIVDSGAIQSSPIDVDTTDGTVDGTGKPASTATITGRGPGTTTVHGRVGGTDATATVTVAFPSVSCLSVFENGATVPADCTATNFTASRPVNTTIDFEAVVHLSDGNICYAPNAPSGSGGQPCNTAVVTVAFGSSNTAVAQFQASPSNRALAKAVGSATITATATDSNSNAVAGQNNVALTVTNPVLNSQLCVESVAPPAGDPVCSSYTAPTIVCGTRTAPDIQTNNSQPFFGFAYFNVPGPNGLRCNVTNSATWNISNFGTPTGNSTVGPSTGIVGAGTVPTTAATVQAMFTSGAVTASGTHDFNVVSNNTQTIANNSMIASTTTMSNDPTNTANFAKPTRVACVGSYDLVAGLATVAALPAQQRMFGVLRRCPVSALQSDGSCDPAQLSNTLEDVTNAEPANNTPAGEITWAVSDGYWDGHQCVIATNPANNVVPALVGDNDALTRYLTAMQPAFTGTGDSRQFTLGTPTIMDNGVGVASGPLRIGTACMTATYAEGNKSARDGVTLIVLPVTNDSLLTDPTASSEVELCNTLVPLFELGASSGGTNGAVTQAIATASEILNPVLCMLSQGTEVCAGPIPTNDLITQIVAAINPATNPVSTAALDPILSAVNSGVYAPLNCAIGQILLGLATQDPAQTNIAACTP